MLSVLSVIFINGYIYNITILTHNQSDSYVQNLKIPSTNEAKTVKDDNFHIKIYDSFLPLEDSDVFFQKLSININWRREQIFVWGKKRTTKRRVAWYADKGKKYSYSGLTLEPETWDEDLIQIKQQIQNITHQEFNSVLLNEYPDGRVGMGWHSDDEKELGIDPIIASVSLGAERDFLFRHKKDKSKEPVKILLKHGSLLLMMGSTQHHWHHSLPLRRKVKEKRINLTFRNIV